MVNGTRGVGHDAAKAIARAFRLDPNYVLQVAGIVPPDESALNSTIQEAVNIMNSLPEVQPKKPLEVIRAFAKPYID